jgi:FMN phosphatase YigB (HAD superfamily)
VLALTLDLWHTLLYLDPEAEERYMQHQVQLAAGALEASPVTPAAPRMTSDQLGRIFEDVLREAVDASSEGRTVTPLQQILEAGRRSGREARADLYIAGLEREVRGTRFRVAPGALETVKGLSEDGYRIAVISNTVGEPGRLFRPILHEMGFDRYLTATIFSDEHPWTKPSPEIFDAALRAVGGRPEQAIHVGDGWSDIEGARRARLRGSVLYTGLQSYGARYKALFLPPDWDRPPTQFRAASWEEIPQIVRTLLPKATPPS